MGGLICLCVDEILDDLRQRRTFKIVWDFVAIILYLITKDDVSQNRIIQVSDKGQVN